MLKNPFKKALAKKKWLTELRESDASLGGWNADATEAERPMGDLSDVINLRKMRPGELELRSGFKQWHLDENGVGPPELRAQTLLWKCEYRLNETFVDVTFYMTGQKIWAVIFDPSQMQASYNLAGKSTVVASYAGTAPIVCAYQFQTYIIVSITDAADDTFAGMYALSPTDATLSTWAVIPLGKEVSPTPTGFTFTQTLTGKLLCFIPAEIDDTTNATTVRCIGYQKDSSGDNRVTALDIKAPYALSGTAYANQQGIPLWIKAKQDPSTQSVESALHAKSRGWWARAVVRRKVVDVRGQTQVISEAPSSDWYVENRTYVPPFFVDPSIHKFPASIRINTVIPPVANDLTGTTVAVPSVAALTELHQKFLDALGGHEIGDHRDALYFVATALSAAGAHPDFSTLFGSGGTAGAAGQPPYKLDADSWEISGAPNVEYTWANFGLNVTPNTTGYDASLYAIDIYRTPYSYPDEGDNATKNPIWADPYNYGYVGTLHASDAKFVDNIQDTNLIFTATPLASNGYLAGEFAGEVMRPYQGRLVLGNTRTKYRVRDPWPGIQAFYYPTPGSGFGASVITTNAGDGLPIAQWYYSYVDMDGNESDRVPIAVSVLDPSVTAGVVAFQFPRGYSQDIVSVNLYQSVNLGTRGYVKEASIACATGVYVSRDITIAHPLPLVYPPGLTQAELLAYKLPTHTVVNSVDPGAIIWSKSSNAWEWPQGNFANLHDQDPITAMDEVIGPLYVASDRGVIMTREEGDKPFAYIEPVMTSAIGTGCISRFGAVKVANRWFFMSAFGLVYVEGSGIVSYPADIETEVRTRLQEIIPNRSMLSGVRNRFSLSYLSNRKEFWGTFPSTTALGGVLPARTFIVKLFEKGANPGMHSAWTTPARYAYEFDIACLPLNKDIYPDWKDRASPNPQGLVIHLPHADGTMYSAFMISEQNVFGTEGVDAITYPGRLIVQNNDVEAIPWYGEYGFQYQHAMGAPSTVKQLFTLRTDMNAKGQLWLKTGMLRRDGLYDRQNGTINTAAPMRGLRLDVGQTLYAWPISGSLQETSGMPVAVRFYGLPDPTSGDSEFWIDAMDIYFGYLHQHMGDA